MAPWKHCEPLRISFGKFRADLTALFAARAWVNLPAVRRCAVCGCADKPLGGLEYGELFPAIIHRGKIRARRQAVSRWSAGVSTRVPSNTLIARAEPYM
jgi:hypothetical protein